jgi:hypothetical protein
MTNRADFRRGLLPLAGLALTATSLISLPGCAEEEPPPVVVAPPPPPPPPPPPALTPITELMAKLGIDPKVRLPEDKAPATDAERIAVLGFYDAFARGDADRLKSMLSTPDQFELDALVSSGDWKKTVDAITRIDVRTGKGNDTGTCTLAVFHVGDSFQPQLWEYKVSGPSAEFDAIACPPGVMDLLSGDDWINAWLGILAKDVEIAQMPDEIIKPPKTDYTTDTSDGESTTGPMGPTPGGGGGPGSPGKRPIGTPIKAPKPGFN